MGVQSIRKVQSSIFDGSVNGNSIYADAEKFSKEEVVPLRFENDTPLEFTGTVTTMLTTSTKLSMQINEVFKPLYEDWYGSEIIASDKVPGMLVVNFLFKALNEGDDEKRAFLPVGKSQNRSSNATLGQINYINAVNRRNDTMEITEYGATSIYSIMSKDIQKSINSKSIDGMRESMKRYVGETHNQIMYSNVQNIYNIVTGIDINKVLSVIFGSKDERDDNIVYKARPIRPVTDMVTSRPNYIVEVQKMTIGSFSEAMRDMGAMPMPGNISAVTETISELRNR